MAEIIEHDRQERRKAEARSRTEFFDRMRKAADKADLSPEEADRLAAESVSAVRTDDHESGGICTIEGERVSAGEDVQMAVTREQARELLDAVPDDRLEAAVAALEPLVDPMLTMLLSASEDDEDLSDEDLEAIAEGEADIARGDIVSAQDVKRRFGIA